MNMKVYLYIYYILIQISFFPVSQISPTQPQGVAAFVGSGDLPVSQLRAEAQAEAVYFRTQVKNQQQEPLNFCPPRLTEVGGGNSNNCWNFLPLSI